ncbi:MAG: addiction module protein [Chitinophagaceae bacterium]|nr:addiction module protein [Chitinophagaceae bacterium]
MPYNVKELLVLPAEEKIILADLLYSSVNEELEENNKTSEWWKDEQFVDTLNKEYEEWKTGKTKGYTIEDVKEFMKEQKVKHRTA